MKKTYHTSTDLSVHLIEANGLLNALKDHLAVRGLEGLCSARIHAQCGEGAVVFLGSKVQ